MAIYDPLGFTGTPDLTIVSRSKIILSELLYCTFSWPWTYHPSIDIEPAIHMNYNRFITPNAMHPSQISNTPHVVFAKSWMTIHLFAWKRNKSLRRLLDSITNAEYPPHSIGNHTVSIVFHVDAGATESVIDMVQSFKWTLGKKYIEMYTTHQGLGKVLLIKLMHANLFVKRDE
jgi:hypothetical protein